MPKECSVSDCNLTSDARGYCNKHYLRWRKYGDPNTVLTIMETRRAIDHPDGTRECTICGEKKPFVAFDRDKGATLGRRSQCKICRGAKVADWYRNNQPRQRDRARERYVRDIDTIRANDTARYQRDREKRIALATDAAHRRRDRISAAGGAVITDAILRPIHGDRCCYCDTLMDFARIPGTRYNPNRATIEHIVPLSAGGTHTLDNTTLCCRQCNLRKNKMSVEAFINRLGPHARGALARAVTQRS